MKVVGPRDNGLVAEGSHAVVFEKAVRKKTSKGKIWFIRFSIISPGNDHGRHVEYILPRNIASGSSFHRFVESALGPVSEGDEIAPEKLKGAKASILVKHVTKRGRVYANVAQVSAPEGS